MRAAWQTPSLALWSQPTVFIRTSTAGVLDSHKDLNQQKMGIPPEHDNDNSVPRQSQEGRDRLKNKKGGRLWVLAEFSLGSGRILFSPDEEHFNKKIQILVLLTQLNGTVWKRHCHTFR